MKHQHRCPECRKSETYIAPHKYREHMEVLRRSDGTPVFRYKGGEDVRVGDRYVYEKWKESDGIGHIDEAMLKAASNAAAWPKCTLIRRAEESELVSDDRSQQLYGEPPDKDGRRVARIGGS